MSVPLWSIRVQKHMEQTANQKTTEKTNYDKRLQEQISMLLQHLQQEMPDETQKNDEKADAEATAKTDDLLWEILTAMQGQVLYTAKGLAYVYMIKGNEMFVSRKDKSITRATVMMAFHRAVCLMREEGAVSGPKRLGTFGASYLYPLFCEIGILRNRSASPNLSGRSCSHESDR